jgi:S1-C subfamily serine protease
VKPRAEINETQFGRRLFVLPVVLAFCLQGPAPAQSSGALPNQSTTTARRLPFPPEARARARRATAAVGLVLVRNAGEDTAPRPRGSAVIVRQDGLAVTNFHVIARDRSDQIYEELYLDLSFEGHASPRRHRLETVVIDRPHDLAIVRIAAGPAGQTPPKPLPSLELADSNRIELLDDLIIIGFPEKGGTTVTVNLGVVEGKDLAQQWIKTDGRLIHGNSGGAAVNNEGKLVGVPTKVVVDYDSARQYGAVGYLRPSNLVAELMARADDAGAAKGPVVMPKASNPPLAALPKPANAPENDGLRIRGVVRSIAGTPVPGARVGIVPAGSQSITADNLLAWGGTDPDGRFELNKPVRAGKYTIRARAIGYELYSRDVEVSAKSGEIIIELSKLD